MSIESKSSGDGEKKPADLDLLFTLGPNPSEAEKAEWKESKLEREKSLAEREEQNKQLSEMSGSLEPSPEDRRETILELLEHPKNFIPAAEMILGRRVDASEVQGSQLAEIMMSQSDPETKLHAIEEYGNKEQ